MAFHAPTERAILSGILEAMEAMPRIIHSNSVVHDQRWRYYASPCHYNPIKISVDTTRMELIFWQGDWFFSGGPMAHGKLHFNSAGRYRVAVLGCLDLSNPLSLTKAVLKEAMMKAAINQTPLELYE